ncbi:MAG: hypothetical protein EOP83_14340 [Verrucomicrobiaceae bacterium]|nr:MAG: hypothetical protein EOP83_14340 [Verrucomicrobiaceae bacterium]
MQRELRLADLRTLQKLVTAVNKEGIDGTLDCSGVIFRVLPAHRAVIIIAPEWRAKCPTKYEIGEVIGEMVTGDNDAFERDMMMLKMQLHGRY